MNKRSYRFIFTLVLVAMCAGTAAAAGTTGTTAAAGRSGPDLVTLNFVNADIEGVVKAVGEITGKNFIIDPRVKGTINIISAKPVSRSLVYEVFLSALRLQGYAAVEERGVVKIVPEADAKMHRGSVSGPRDAPRGETVSRRASSTLSMHRRRRCCRSCGR